ncbi:acetolactate synthase 2 catalytic subunit [Mangrovitalea sediminis]|uniref:acetolactate synthase 2 catalytic subunit n=1 Tax=Mangrovitalea sediminis TaxID=1982043 RepID=UPI000BE589B2|nr:acetolactate synthase 2 catalytic subunit [Mangrovitalea sediminis]
MNGAQHIIEAFRRHRIDTVFGYPGGCIMPLYDALVESDVAHVLCRHEQACALSAGGYSRASGRLGVCIATSGPGATNLITGVADAHRDSVPLLVITGQVASGLIGTDAFQETDVLGMTLGIVKHSYLVTEADELPRIMDEAIDLATSGRPGPVWIDVPKDVLLQAAESPEVYVPSIAAPRQPDEKALERARQMLRQAKRPLLYSGGGIKLGGAIDAFRAFANATGLPNVETLHGLGNAGLENANRLGMLGMHGSRAANMAVDVCDLLIVVGARLDDRATGRIETFAPNAGLIHIDGDQAELGKLREADIALRGDLSVILAALSMPLALSEWQSQCRSWRAQYGFQPMSIDAPEAPISGPAFIRQLSRITGGRAIISCDVGQHQMWVAQYYDFDHPRQHLTSGGLGTMGFGLPAAIGARMASPETMVINVSGDGSFMMNAQEMATIKRYRLPVKMIILDNQCLGMVRQQQELFYEGRESEIDLSDNPDFGAMARAFDIPHLDICQANQIRRGIETLMAYPGPMLLHVAIQRQDNVWPIVKPGEANLDMIEGKPQSQIKTQTQHARTTS